MSAGPPMSSSSVRRDLTGVDRPSDVMSGTPNEVVKEVVEVVEGAELCPSGWLEEVIDTALGLTALAEDAVWLCRARSRGRASDADLLALAETGRRALADHLEFWRTSRSSVDREAARALLITHLTELLHAFRLLEHVVDGRTVDRELERVVRRFDRAGARLLDGVIALLPQSGVGVCASGSADCTGTVLQCPQETTIPGDQFGPGPGPAAADEGDSLD